MEGRGGIFVKVWEGVIIFHKMQIGMSVSVGAKTLNCPRSKYWTVPLLSQMVALKHQRRDLLPDSFVRLVLLTSD